MKILVVLALLLGSFTAGAVINHAAQGEMPKGRPAPTPEPPPIYLRGSLPIGRYQIFDTHVGHDGAGTVLLDTESGEVWGFYATRDAKGGLSEQGFYKVFVEGQ